MTASTAYPWPPVSRIEVVAELGTPAFPGELQRDIAVYLIRLQVSHRGHPPFVVLRTIHGHGALDQICSMLLANRRLPTLILGNLEIVNTRVQRVDVVGDDIADNKPLCDDGLEGHRVIQACVHTIGGEFSGLLEVECG